MPYQLTHECEPRPHAPDLEPMMVFLAHGQWFLGNAPDEELEGTVPIEFCPWCGEKLRREVHWRE